MIVIRMLVGFAVVVVMSLPLAARADLVLHQRETMPVPGEERARTSEKEIAIARNMMRIRDIDSGMIVIVRLDKRVVWELSPDGDEYIEIPFDYLKTMNQFEDMTEEQVLEAQLALAADDEKAEIARALEEARARKLDAPAEVAEEREALDAERTKREEERPTVAWTGRSDRIAGFVSREATLSVGMETVAEVWVTSDAFFKNELDSYLDAMKSLGQAGGGLPADLEALGGFPMRTVLYASGDATAPPLVLEIVRALRESLPPWEFDLPPGAERAPLAPREGSSGR
ncbi:MAG: DUF4412 domain-containing protein [bacterium]